MEKFVINFDSSIELKFNRITISLTANSGLLYWIPSFGCLSFKRDNKGTHIFEVNFIFFGFHIVRNPNFKYLFHGVFNNKLTGKSVILCDKNTFLFKK